MKNQDVCNAFAKGRNAKTANLRTDGERIWSYTTVIGQKGEGGKVFINYSCYSKTSSHHRTDLLKAVIGRYDIIPVHGCARGVQNIAN